MTPDRHDPADAVGPGASRRAVLRWGLAVIASSLAGAGVVESTAAVGARSRNAAHYPAHVASRPATAPSPHTEHPWVDVAANPPPSGRAGPAAAGGHGDAPLPTWMLPVYSLPGYTARHPGISFPRDAVMLTIDDGPHPVWTPKILRLLQRHHVTATFCVIGRQAVEYPQLVDAVASEGHCLANHSFTHPRLPSLPAGAMYRQVLDTQDAITRAAATTPTLFRAPCGQWSPALLRLLAGHRLTPIDWDVDARDWARPGTARVITALDAAAPGDILLCHDGGGDRSQTYQALQTVLPRLTARGLRFVTLPAPRQ